MEQNSIIGSLQKKKSTLSELEKRVLDFILNKYQKISSMSIDDISREVYVSTATISRTSQKLGYEGYRELKYAIIQNQSSTIQNKDDNNFDVEIKNFMQENINNLKGTIDNLEDDDLIKAVHLISHASLIEIMGVGASLTNGMDLARKLTFLGKIATSRTDWDELYAISNNMTENDLAICMSSSGETTHVINYAKRLKNNNVPILAIVSNRDSQLAKLSTITLVAKTNHLYIGDVDLSSRHSALFIIDLLLMMYAKNN
nr:MurR/RpiR family transcriptional regulator [Mammaliicoccus sp. Marseille-Q6498]